MRAFEPISNELLKLPTDVVTISDVLIPVNTIGGAVGYVVS
jgi:hypothetical protein